MSDETPSLEEIRTNLSRKTVKHDGMDVMECKDYFTNIHGDKFSGISKTISKEQYSEMDLFVRKNGLEAKDYKIYSGLAYGMSIEECAEYYLDELKPHHPIIIKNRGKGYK
tara:strand:+ start:1392 stop:1724 length:333 start_codon:yes stop_codon:yes gene_type:complete